jgi:hypothetical protein
MRCLGTEIKIRSEGRKYFICESWDSVVGIATVYGLDDREVGVRVPVGLRIFSSPQRPNGFWGPPSLLSNEYRASIPRGKAVRA